MSVSKTLSLSIAALAVAMIAGPVAQAAPAAKAKAAKTTKAAKTVAAAAPKADDSTLDFSDADGIESASDRIPAAANGPAVLNMNSTVPAATSSSSLPAAIQAAAPRTVFGELYTETYTAYDDITSGKGSPQFDSFAGVKFDLGNSRSLSLRQNFDYTGLTDVKSNVFHIQDIAINYSDAKLATFMGDGSLTLIAREYLPTGENSRFMTGNVGAERVYLVAAKSFGKWDLDVLTMAQLSNNTKDSFMAADGSGEKQNRWGYATYEFDSMYNFNSKFAAGVTAYVEHKFFRPLAGKADSTADMGLQPILQFTPRKGLALQAALINEIEIAHPKQPIAPLRTEELQAYFNLSATL